jgi:ubiquinone/menaquinone biosynthesis C-methylase UbiE
LFSLVQQGLGPLTTVVRGDFTQMPFEANTFDGAYAIEATCHAPKVQL